MKLIVEKNIPTDPSKWSYYKSQAKEKFDVYPSAYANAWAAKQYKDAGGGWRTEESVVNETKNEPKIISQLKDIVKSGSKVLTDPATGKKMRVDSYSASAIISVYNGLNQSSNKDKFVNSGLLKMQSVAFKILNKYGQPKNEAKRDLGFEMGDFVHLKSKNKTGMVLKVQGNKVTIRTMNGPVTGTLDDVMILAQDGVNEAKRDLGFEMGDFVHLKSKNKTGMVLKVQGNKVTIRTMNGPVTGTLDDVMILAQDGINEGNAFTGALFNARKQGLSEFEFGGKKYPVINEMGDDDEPSASSIRKAGKAQVAQKQEMLKIQKTLKDNAKDTAAFTKINPNERTTKQKAHLKKMADLTAKLKKLKTLTEDIDLGHQDDEPNMLRADLFRIVKYAKELYEMLKQFDDAEQEVDFPHWWQSDIIRAKELMVNAKHYLNGELNVNGNPLGESKKKVRI
jgi:hypothetical protein